MQVDNAEPLVSIIMPTYNRAWIIMETIESIRRQTFRSWELIIVDDGSNDNTEQVVAAYKDIRIKLIKAGRIGIGGKTKNIGISNAAGRFIAFIDSDDLWAETKLEKQLDALNRYPEAGYCLTGGYIFKKEGLPDHYFYPQQDGERMGNLFIAVFKSEVTGYTQALMLRKECFNETGLFREEKSFSDIDFIINLALSFKGIILYEPLVYRRIHESNYIIDTWDKSCREGIEIILEYEAKLPRGVARDALFKAYIQWGEKCLDHHQHSKARKHFIKAWQYKPTSIVPFKKVAKTFFPALRGK